MYNFHLLKPDDAELVIPDKWSGLNINTVDLNPSFLPPKFSGCSTRPVTIDLIVDNNYAAMGVRALLENKRYIRLQHLRHHFDNGVYIPDVIIMTVQNKNDVNNVYSRVLRERSLNKRTTVVILAGDHIGTLNTIAAIFGGIFVIPLADKIDRIDKLLDNVLDKRKHKTESLPDLLTINQRMVLNMLAKNNSICQISKELSMSIKNVYAYRSRIFKRLGVKNKAQVATLYEVIQRIIKNDHSNMFFS
ncbi:helix-turn-helix transcriptional regulator [Salmonella enterica subsp. enterica]|nr:helix-turn-helix transcriptional regulator [Salmonella enterica subsp. enterica]